MPCEKFKQLNKWHSTNPFERTGRRDQLPAYKIFSDFTGIWTIVKRLANSKCNANIQRGSVCRSEKPPAGEPTSTCSYVMERITKFALIQFAVSQQLMSKRPYGFLHGTSCLTNLLNASEQWTRALDKNSGVYVIYFTLRKLLIVPLILGCYTS